jgi:hypothetical protein
MVFIPKSVKSKLQALRIGSFEDPIDLEEIGEEIN